MPEPWPAEMVVDCDIAEVDCVPPWIDAWATDRQQAVDRIIDNGWGVGDDNVLRGPGGLVVDLGDCPSGWDSMASVSDDEIRLALVSQESGNIGPGLAYGCQVTSMG